MRIIKLIRALTSIERKRRATSHAWHAAKQRSYVISGPHAPVTGL